MQVDHSSVGVERQGRPAKSASTSRPTHARQDQVGSDGLQVSRLPGHVGARHDQDIGSFSQGNGVHHPARWIQKRVANLLGVDHWPSLAKDSRKLKALLLRERERKAKERIGFPKGPKSALEEVPMTVKKSIHERQQAKLPQGDHVDDLKDGA